MIREILELTRFEHAIMLALAVFISMTIILGEIPDFTLPIIFAYLVPVLSEMGSFALNDYFDVETDRINKKMGPIVRGSITKEFALILSIIAFAISTILAFFINDYAFAIVVVFNLLAIAYNWKLKDTPLIGNVFIGFTMAIPFVFGNYVVSNELTILTIILAMLGFIAGFAREIIKSVEDVQGDVLGRGSKTIPSIIGIKKSIMIALAAYLLFIPLTIVPLSILGYPLIPFFLVGVADFAILVVCIKAYSGDYKFARKISLLAFAIGLLAILIAAL